jgi:hypothetical protein
VNAQTIVHVFLKKKGKMKNNLIVYSLTTTAKIMREIIRIVRIFDNLSL